jgi:hypothetical protein
MNHYQILNSIKKINIIIKNDCYIYNFLLNMCIQNLICLSLLLFITYDLSNANNIYYDENYNELHMNKTEYFDYLYNKYSEFDNTYNKYNFIENLKYHFDMKNKNINENGNKNDFYFEHSLIATNEKDYKNHKLLYNLNKNYYVNINNLMTNYYNNMCNKHKNLCGNNNLYYYPYFNAYNVNVFNYIFNRIYKSFVNFDIDEMLKKVPNINEMTKNILIEKY